MPLFGRAVRALRRQHGLCRRRGGRRAPIVLDLGTGLRPLGHALEERYGLGNPVEVTAFLTHLHWDHIIGLPFCTPLLREGGKMDVYGPPQDGGSLHDIIDRVVKPPFFPVQVKELQGKIEFYEVDRRRLRPWDRPR